MTKKKTKSTKKVLNNNNSESKNGSITPEKLIEQGQLCISNMQLELACRFFRRALEMSPNETTILDLLAEVLLQLGESIEAFSLLEKSTNLEPGINPTKWCYMAQLQEGADALLSYQKAIQILLNFNPSLISEEENASNRKLVAKCYCSIGELYLTDLCFEVDAEVSCETAITKSLEIDVENLDALQALASLRMSQSRPNDAAETIEKVYTRIMNARKESNSRTIIEDMTTSPDDPCSNDKDMPESSFCVSTARLLIECAAIKFELAELAVDLLCDLLSYDDENIELWYLAGVASMTMKPPDLEASRYHLEKAANMLKCLKNNAYAANEEFLFREQEELVTDHLKILTELEESVNLNDHHKEGQDNMAVDKDEEWSICDEDNDDEEEEKMK